MVGQWLTMGHGPWRDMFDGFAEWFDGLRRMFHGCEESLFRHWQPPQCLANGWPMVGQWLANGWPSVGQWLAKGGPMVGQWLTNGWPKCLDKGWPMVGQCMTWIFFFPSKRLCLESRTMLAHNFQSFAHDFDARCIIRRCMCSNVMTHS